jgi:hypothetical protein
MTWPRSTHPGWKHALAGQTILEPPLPVHSRRQGAHRDPQDVFTRAGALAEASRSALSVRRAQST